MELKKRWICLLPTTQEKKVEGLLSISKGHGHREKHTSEKTRAQVIDKKMEAYTHDFASESYAMVGTPEIKHDQTWSTSDKDRGPHSDHVLPVSHWPATLSNRVLEFMVAKRDKSGTAKCIRDQVRIEYDSTEDDKSYQTRHISGGCLVPSQKKRLVKQTLNLGNEKDIPLSSKE